ncbi:MAG: 50S ribosomal protein L11 methyltransferase, partial [Thermoanaerobaculia bacterium]|nr:50S ribosomal protein L11 methyltransferase [Thermoanaerobaculia bacterium]
EALAGRLDGARVLDLGSGSGVLSFVAEGLGARRVLGVEIEREAALLGGANRTLNRSDVWLVAGTIDGLAPDRRFDVIVANVLAARLLPLLPALAARLAAGGRLVLSGALVAEEERVRAAAVACDLSVVGRWSEGEWLAVLLAGGA